jgi:hypothetical protein
VTGSDYSKPAFGSAAFTNITLFILSVRKILIARKQLRVLGPGTSALQDRYNAVLVVL